MLKEKLKNNKIIMNAVKINEMDILPGHLSFYFIFIIIPIISFIGLVSSQLDLGISKSLINNNIPKAVLDLIEDMQVNTNNINLLFFTILSLWLSSRGTKAIIIASNLLFKVKEIDIIKIRLKAILVTMILFILISFIIIVPILGDLIIKYINNISDNSVIYLINNIYHLLKYPISIILIFFLIKILYTISLTVDINSKYMNKGSFFTTISWLLSSRIYSFYLNNYNNYNLYYGSMSNILVLLVWVYLLSYIFVMGISINANDYFNKNIDCNSENNNL